MATPKKRITDRERFMRELKRVAGSGEIRYSTDRWGSTVEKETWWCPSCRTPKALTLRYPEWLTYPKPRCSMCSDREVYEVLGLQELAFRGSSPPLVVCHVAQGYKKKTGQWPVLEDRSEGLAGWKGGCRRCEGCREFERTRQAHVLGPRWAKQLAALAELAIPPCAWAIQISEGDRRRALDALKYLAKPRGGAVAQVPVEGGRAVAAVFTPPPHGRTTPIQRRLRAEGRRLVERRRLPSDQRGSSMIHIDEQLEGFLIDSFSRRFFERGSRTVKRSINLYKRPVEGHPTDCWKG